eukprot:g26453.t1
MKKGKRGDLYCRSFLGKKDPDVKCVQYVKHDRPAPPKAKAEAAVSSDSEGSSSSDSEGESSASSSASGSSPARLCPAGPAVAKPELSAASKGSRARACAKMMVRAGLRCGCHFETQCPERSRGHRGQGGSEHARRVLPGEVKRRKWMEMVVAELSVFLAAAEHRSTVEPG